MAAPTELHPVHLCISQAIMSYRAADTIAIVPTPNNPPARQSQNSEETVEAITGRRTRGREQVASQVPARPGGHAQRSSLVNVASERSGRHGDRAAIQTRFWCLSGAQPARASSAVSPAEQLSSACPQSSSGNRLRLTCNLHKCVIFRRLSGFQHIGVNAVRVLPGSA